MKKIHVKILTSVVFLVSLSFYFYRIDQPSIQIWDEQYHIPAAHSYLIGIKENYKNLRNPPLGKELIALSNKTFGDNFFAYRLPSALAAAGIAALLFWIACSLTGKWMGGCLALGLWLTSTLAYIHAHLAMLDMLTAFFLFAGLAAFLHIFPSPRLPVSPSPRFYIKWLYLACLMAGLGGAIKVLDYLLLPLFFIGLLTLRKQWPLSQSLPHLFAAGVLFPAFVLFLTYGVLGFAPNEIPRQMALIAKLQSAHHRDFLGLSPWYDWFLLKGSLWYYSDLLETGKRVKVLCINNPILWILGTASLGILFVFGILKKNAIFLLIFLSVLLQIIFWMVFKDQTILTYGLPMEPIFCMAIALALFEITKNLKKADLTYHIWAITLFLASAFFFWRQHPFISEGLIR